MGTLIGISGNPKGSDSKTIGKTVNNLWLLPGDFSSAASILTNDTLAGGHRWPLSLNVVEFHLDLMPLGSSIEGNQKGLFRNPKFIDVRCPALPRYGRISIQCVLDIVTLDTVTAQSP